MTYIHCRHESRQKSQIKSLNVECGFIGFTEQEKAEEKRRRKCILIYKHFTIILHCNKEYLKMQTWKLLTIPYVIIKFQLWGSKRTELNGTEDEIQTMELNRCTQKHHKLPFLTRTLLREFLSPVSPVSFQEKEKEKKKKKKKQRCLLALWTQI